MLNASLFSLLLQPLRQTPDQQISQSHNQITTWAVSRARSHRHAQRQRQVADQREPFCTEFYPSNLLRYYCPVHPDTHSRRIYPCTNRICVSPGGDQVDQGYMSDFRTTLYSIGRFITSIFSAIANVLITIVSAIVRLDFQSSHFLQLLTLLSAIQTDLFVCIFTCGKSRGGRRSRKTTRSGL
jgi:hypothetical protein